MGNRIVIAERYRSASFIETRVSEPSAIMIGSSYGHVGRFRPLILFAVATTSLACSEMDKSSPTESKY
jgi:hypothetical protein